MRGRFARIGRNNLLELEQIQVIAEPSTPEKAIDRPEDVDYPVLKAEERLMEAEFKG